MTWNYLNDGYALERDGVYVAHVYPRDNWTTELDRWCWVAVSGSGLQHGPRMGTDLDAARIAAEAVVRMQRRRETWDR